MRTSHYGQHLHHGTPWFLALSPWPWCDPNEAGVVDWSCSALARSLDATSFGPGTAAVQSAVLLVVNRLCVGESEVKAWWVKVKRPWVEVC